jgi:hypothetical protein
MTIRPRPKDTARASRMVLAVITDDQQMLTLALSEAVTDEHPRALLNTIASLASAIGSSAVGKHGQAGAEQLLQRTIAETLRAGAADVGGMN